MLDRSRGGFLGGGMAGGVVTGPLTMAPGQALTVDATEGVQFSGSGPTTKINAVTADQVVHNRLGVAQQTINANGIASNVSHTMAGTLFLNAAFRPTIVATAIDYTLLTSDRAVVATAGCATITMPASPSVGARWEIWNNTGGTLTLARAGSQTINGATSVSIAAGAHVILANSATNVFLAGEAPPA